MTRDEQKAITEFIVRASCPEQSTMDVEADAIIRALFVRNPEAAYRITKLAMRQEAALQALTLEQLPCPASVSARVPVKTAGGWLNTMLKREEKREAVKTRT